MHQLTSMILVLLLHWKTAQSYDPYKDAYLQNLDYCADGESCEWASKSSPQLGFNSRKVGDISIKKCKEYSKSVVRTISFGPISWNSKPIEISSQKCKFYGTELIVGGEMAKLGEFPHMAALGWANENDGYNFKCGGSLISERFVLTAGHCTTSFIAANEPPVVVRLGDKNLDPDVNDGAEPVEVPIKNIYKHPEFKSPSRYNDIALLELFTNVPFGDSIRPACLWTDPDLGKHQRALATGWGFTETEKTSNDLLKVSLSIMDNTVCNDSLADKIGRKWSHGFDETQLCAGENRKGKDSCQGDSGGPLQVVSEDNQCIYKIIGITSFGGKFCGYSPAVYTKVSKFISWIESVVWPNQ